MVIWITGLSGAGKTTLGDAVFEKWKCIAPNTVMVDGDVVRELYRLDSKPELYTMEGRQMVATRIHELCAWLDGQGINVVCCTISLFAALHDMNRRQFSEYFEVFVDVPMDILRRRDNKNLYTRAFSGEMPDVVGVDLPFSPPEAPDMRIDNSHDLEEFDELAVDVLTAARIL